MYGKMGESMMGNIVWERSKDMANMYLRMEKSIKESGRMENNMVGEK
jgi:hypothetical protein